MQMIREYTYVYSAVCPRTGESLSLILPYADTESMMIFMRELSEFYKDYRLVVVMDGAAWHRSQTLKPFDNIACIFQPPYSPEVNPTEHLWEHLREKYFHNCIWDSIEKQELYLMEALREVEADRETIRKLTGFHWAAFNV